jgi:hypothetical protein
LIWALSPAARGHKTDWDFFASEAGDSGWSYESVLNIYHRIEDWHGAPDPKYRGTGGRLFVQRKAIAAMMNESKLAPDKMSALQRGFSPAHLLHRIRTALKKIQAAALG